MRVMPSSKNRRRVEIPAGQYERLKQIADEEERTVTSVLSEILGSGLRSYQSWWVPGEHRDKLTARASRVLDLAREEAPRRFRHHYVGTEHQLLALVEEGEGLAAEVLGRFGVDAAKVSAQIVSIVGLGKEPAGGQVEMTPRARKVLGLAVDEARKLDHGFVGTGHLLLGLVREGQGIAMGVLERLKVDSGEVREAVLQALSRGERPLSET